jgi:catechol 1,2-dioxygenase
MERNEFLKKGLLTAFSMSVLGQAVSALDGSFKGSCETTNDILGPFYRENAPVRNDLTIHNPVGNRIYLKGNVFENDCITPIKDASIEIWHCDVSGNYDNDSAEFKNRAQWLSDSKGAYNFKTILPGKYLNGKLYRPSHIHFRITAKGYKEIISQLYFEGDPHITSDPWASDKKAEHRIIKIIPEDVQGGLTLVFNMYLSKQ